MANKSKNYHIVDMSKETLSIKRDADIWKTHDAVYGPQVNLDSINPPGILEGDTIFVFAGNTGGVSSALKYGKITFSDIVPWRLEAAKKTFSKKGRSVNFTKPLDAANLKLVNNSFDWLFSHDPLPLKIRYYLTPQYALIAKKGIILSFFSKQYATNIYKEFEQVARIYEMEVEYSKENVSVINGNHSQLELTYLILKNNSKTKILASIDLKVLEELNKLHKEKFPSVPHNLLYKKMTDGIIFRSDIESLRKELNIKPKTMRDSLNRNNRLVAPNPKENAWRYYFIANY